MELKTIAIIGAGGKVGSAIIQAILDNSSIKFDITAVTRSTSTYKAPDPSIIIKSVDLTSSAALIAAFDGQDAVLSCTGAHAVKFDAQKLIIDSAIAAGVKLFFADEYVGDILRPQFRAMPAHFVGDKIQIREYLEEKAKEGRICWTALNGGPFFDMWLIKGPAGFDIRNHHARIYGTGNNHMCWTQTWDMGIAVANILRNPDPFLNRAIFVCGVRDLSQKAILAALEAELGKKFTVDYVDIKKLKEQAVVALEKNEIGKAMKGLTLSAQYNEEDNAVNFWTKAENALVGVEAVSVEEAVKSAIAVWGTDVEVVASLFNVKVDE